MLRRNLLVKKTMKKLKAEITEINIYGVLDKNVAHDPNKNIEILTNVLNDAKISIHQ